MKILEWMNFNIKVSLQEKKNIIWKSSAEKLNISLSEKFTALKSQSKKFNQDFLKLNITKRYHKNYRTLITSQNATRNI